MNNPFFYLIPQLANHTFSVSGAQKDDSTVENWNEFKKNPGVGGFSRITDINGDPIGGAKVILMRGSTIIAGAVSRIRNPDPDAEKDFRATLRAAKKNLILVDEFLLGNPHLRFFRG